MMIDVLNTHGEKAIGVELHASSSDKLYAKEAEDIGNYSAFAGYPTFTADLKGDFYPASALKTKIDQNAGQPIQAVLGLHKWFDGGKLKVKARANFKANLTGVYNMALWVIEDSIPDVQAGQSANPYLHNHVYRISANNKIWGTQIANNDASENKTVNLDFEVPMNTKWVQKNLKVIAILFKMNGSTPEAIVNSFEK